MPARPMVLDEIDLKMRGSVQVDILIPDCCVASCDKGAVGMLSLRFNNGSTDVYGLCRSHIREMKSRHPTKLERESKQGAFFYAGS